MEKIEAPKTIEDFQKVLASILELQANPHCDRKMFLDLIRRESDVRIEIALLKNGHN